MTPPATELDSSLLLAVIESDEKAKSSTSRPIHHTKPGKIIGLVTLLTVLIGIVHALIAPPLFHVNSLIQIQGPEKNGQTHNDNEPLLEGWMDFFGGEGEVVAEIETIRSHQTLSRVVDQLYLDITVAPRYFPVLGETIAHQHNPQTGSAPPPLLGLDRDTWNGEHLQVDRLDVPPQYLGEEFILVAGKTGTYRLLEPRTKSFLGLAEWFTPEPPTLTTGQVGTTIQHDLNGKSLTLAISALTASPGTEFTLTRNTQQAAIESLQRRLEVTEKPRGSGIVEVALQDSDPILAAAIVNTIVDDYLHWRTERDAKKAARLREMYEEKLEAFEKQRVQLKAQLEVATTDLDRLHLEHDLLDPPREFQQLREQTAKVAEQIKQIQQKREEAIRRFSPTHPTVNALDTRLAHLTQDEAEINQRRTSLSDTWRELTRRSREVAINTQIYLSLLNNIQTLTNQGQGLLSAQEKRQELAQIPRFITRATPPSVPIPTKMGNTIVFSLALGIILGILVNHSRRGNCCSSSRNLGHRR
ncbi:hypothetical protein CCP3SC1_1190003 [Gammaproteobacteria bacterium]